MVLELRAEKKATRKWTRLLKEEYDGVQILSTLGGFSTVLKGRNKRLNRIEAIKAIDCLEISKFDELGLERTEREIAIMAKLNHSNIVQIYNVLTKSTQEEDFLFIIMEYCEDQLTNVLEKYKKGISKPLAVKYITEIVNGVGYLHENKILHRDLKPANIFLKDGIIKIGDFNISKMIGVGSTTRISQKMCSLRYCPPEYFKGVTPNYRYDAWSIGCIFHELLTGNPAIKGNDEGEIVRNLLAINYIPPPKLDPLILDIFKYTITQENERMTVIQIRKLIHCQEVPVPQTKEEKKTDNFVRTAHTMKDVSTVSRTKETTAQKSHSETGNIDIGKRAKYLEERRGSRICEKNKNEHGEKLARINFKWEDGGRYVGDVLGDDIHGVGTYFWADGRVYKGEWVKNKMQGHGLFTFPDGRIYKGCYHEDKKHGHGSHSWPDGRHYIGPWRNGVQHGEGIFTSAKGSKRKGLWFDGKLVRWLQEL